MREEIKRIGFVTFHDVSVDVYYDTYHENKKSTAIWRMRNPDSCYKGAMFMNNDIGKMSYPPDTIIPIQTAQDREQIPISIIIGEKELTPKLIEQMSTYMKLEHKRRNKL